MLTWSIA